MAIRSDDITQIIKSAIDEFDAGAETRSVGSVVEVGDGIARIYGLDGALASELLEFPGGVKGMALNLEEETVGAVILGDYTQIKEGQNIFGFDIGAVREYVMANSPNFQSMTITRYLPNKVVINVIDRTPLARIGHRGGMVADSEGCVFISRSGTRGLPTIGGYDSRSLEPGMRLQGNALAALQVIEGCDSLQIDMRPLDVDVKDPERLVLKMEYRDRKREVLLTWNGMGQQTSAARRNLFDTLAYIKQAFDTPKGARLAYLDATVDGRLYGR